MNCEFVFVRSFFSEELLSKFWLVFLLVLLIARAISSKIVVEVHVGALRDLVDESHLEQLVDDLEDKVFRIEVLEGRAYTLVDAIEAETALGCL